MNENYEQRRRRIADERNPLACSWPSAYDKS